MLRGRPLLPGDAPNPIVVDSTQVPGLSIVIPAWNEEERLPETLEQFVPVLSQRKDPYEIIVVSDGSTDRTDLVGMKYASQGVRVLSFPERLGKGGAVLEGFKHTSYETVGYIDADGPVPAREAIALAGHTKAFDCVVASRRIAGENVVRVRSASRRLFSLGWNLMVRGLLNLPVRDTQCGVKFFRRETLLPVLDQVQSRDWTFDVELLFHLRQARRTMTEIPVTWEEKEGTKMALPKVIPAMFLSLLKIRAGTRRGFRSGRRSRAVGSGAVPSHR